MDRSEVRAIVERAIEPLMERLSLTHWQVTVSYDLRADYDGANVEATCSRLADYDKAWIELDPDQLDDEAAVLKALRHELFHIVLAPFDLFNALARDAASEDARPILDRVQVHATEKAVINLERMFALLTSEG